MNVERESETTPMVMRESLEDSMAFDFDAIIVHGKNWRRYPIKARLKNKFEQIFNDKDPLPLKLSKDSRFASMAVGEIYNAFLRAGKKPPVFIFSTGHTAGADKASEAEAIAEYTKKLYPDIPNEHIVLEDKSYDTVGNIHESKKIIEDNEFNNVGYITVGYHLPRVQLLMDYYDAPIDVIFPSQKWAAKRSPRHARFVDGYEHSKQWRNHTIGEKLLIGEMIPDPGQKALNATLAKLIRHQ